MFKLPTPEQRYQDIREFSKVNWEWTQYELNQILEDIEAGCVEEENHKRHVDCIHTGVAMEIGTVLLEAEGLLKLKN